MNFYPIHPSLKKPLTNLEEMHQKDIKQRTMAVMDLVKTIDG